MLTSMRLLAGASKRYIDVAVAHGQPTPLLNIRHLHQVHSFVISICPLQARTTPFSRTVRPPRRRLQSLYSWRPQAASTRMQETAKGNDEIAHRAARRRFHEANCASAELVCIRVTDGTNSTDHLGTFRTQCTLHSAYGACRTRGAPGVV